MFSRLLFLMIGVCALLPMSNRAAAQDAPHAFAHGTVVDSLKEPLMAQVLVFDSTNKVVASANTDESGEFILGGLVPHTSYLFSIRKFGFSAGMTQLVTPKAGDTLWIDVMLRPMPPTLNTVKVTANANPAYHVSGGGYLQISGTECAGCGDEVPSAHARRCLPGMPT